MSSLFTERTRQDLRPARHAESHYAYLDASGRPAFEYVRGLFDEWFANYPASQRADLAGRFASKHDRHHLAAAFELFLHEVLRRMGCDVEVHPAIDGHSKKPDFRCSPLSGDAFYVEAVTVGNEDEFGYSPGENAVLDAINELHCPNFWLWADQCGTVGGSPPLRRLRVEAQRWIDQLDYEALNAEPKDRLPAPSFEFLNGEWTLRLGAIPRGAARGDESARPLGNAFTKGGWGDGSESLRSAIARKATSYGRFPGTLIIAVNALSIAADSESYLRAIGPTPGTRSESPLRAHVAAVLGFRGVFPWTVDVADGRIFPNADAAASIPDVLRPLPQGRSGRDGQMEFQDGTQPRELLNLPPIIPMG